jgi:GntR family transcriptional regulator
MADTSNRSRYQRRRPTPPRSNNSVRRTYDLLRSTLPTLEPEAMLVEEELVELLSASRNTVRLVLQLLATHGLVTRGPKVGTVVASSTVLPIDEIMPIADQGMGRLMSSTILESLVIPAPAIVSQRLELAEKTPIAIVEGLVLDEDMPLALAVIYLCLPPAERHEVGHECPDVVALLEEFDICIGECDTTVAALASDAQTAALLDVPEGSPILWCEDLVRDKEGTPRAISQVRYRADRVTFSATARRRGATDQGPAMTGDGGADQSA